MPRNFTFDIAGAISFWELEDAPVDAVIEIFNNHGFGHIVPKARTEDNALTLAMKEHSLSRDFRVERRKNAVKNGRELVHVKRGETSNDYDVSYSAKVVDGQVVVDYGCPVPQYKLQSSFEKYKGLITTGELGRKMVDVVRALKGQTNISTKGGVYFIPLNNLDVWENFSQDIENLKPGNRVHIGRVKADEKSARMVIEAVTQEVLEEAGRIVNDIDNLELNDEQVQARIRDSGELIDKIEAYSDLLGQQKQTLIDIATQAKQVACKATWSVDAMVSLM